MTEDDKNKEEYFETLFKKVKEGDRENFRDRFLTLHERDQQELFHLLYPENKRKIAAFLTPEEFAEIFQWMQLADQEDAVAYLPQDFMVDVFDYLPTDILASFVPLTEEDNIEEILRKMDEQEYRRLQEVLSYEHETAGSIMTKEYFYVSEEETTQEVIDRIRTFGARAETIYYLYVVSKNHELVGVLSLRDLLLTPEHTKVHEAMNHQAVSVRVDEDQEEVAKVIQDYDLIAIPVVTHDQRLVGIITVDDIMDIVEQESDEDFHEFAGISATKGDEHGGSSPMSAAKQRAPWIIILLFLSMVSGGLISVFESTLASVVSLAAFIPLIMAAAGNVGTQSLAVSLRNMSEEDDEDKDMKIILFNEAKTGVLLGGVSGVVVFGIVMVLYQDLVLSLIVGMSIFLSIIISAVIGTLIPDVIRKLNFDPAVASGPFITTINDTLGLLIYFIIASALIAFM